MIYKSAINNAVTSIEKKQQKIADRIQEKLNFIKSGYETKANDIIKRRDHTPITGKKVKQPVTNTSNTTSPAVIVTSKRDPAVNVRKQRQSFLQRKQKTSVITQQAKNIVSRSRQKQQSVSIPYNTNQQRISQSSQQRSIQQRMSHQQRNPSTSNQLSSNPSKESFPTKIVHNNWIINNQVLKENTSLNEAQMMKSSVKQLGSKSVIIVKPNQFNQQQSVNQRSDSRQSLRKVSNSQAKMADKQNRASINKENTAFVSNNPKNSKFFRVDKNDSSSTTSIGMVKMRSSSTKPIRKDDLANSSIMKNSSYSGKGKWKC